MLQISTTASAAESKLVPALISHVPTITADHSDREDERRCCTDADDGHLGHSKSNILIFNRKTLITMIVVCFSSELTRQ